MTKSNNLIASNKKARHEFFIEESIEAGIVLEGWEVKSLRSGKVQITDSYILLKKGEAWLIGAIITPLLSASTHITPESNRTRKLLLHRKQLNNLQGLADRKGYTLIPTKLYWYNNRVKIEIALAKGKKQYDKRETIKNRDWQRQKQKAFKKTL